MSNPLFVPPLFPRGTFTGVPSRFRGWCMTASQGGSTGGYHWVGRRFGDELLELTPHGLEVDEWLSLVQVMVEQYLEHPAGPMLDSDGIAAWLHRHFPLMMKLIPTDRLSRFVDGFVEAYTEGDMMDDFPADFEAVDVNLDDPCCGEGYIRTWYQNPPREVVYQCPAPSCREASRRAVEEYGAKEGLTVVVLGDTIATVQPLSV